MARQGNPRRDFWLSHLRKWHAQGGTMKAHAQANDLPVDNFYAAKSAYARGLTQSDRTNAVSRQCVALLGLEVEVGLARLLTGLGHQRTSPLERAQSADDHRVEQTLELIG